MNKFLIFLLVVIFAVSVSAQALTCTKRNDCLSATTNPNFIDCIDGQCQCLPNSGIQGSATTASKCACPADWDVIWSHDGPKCLNVANAITMQQEYDRCVVLKSKVAAVYDLLVYPFSGQIITAYMAGLPSAGSTLFSNISDGRVDPAGEFHNYSGFVEYFWGAAYYNPRVVSVDKIALLCEQNKVTVRVNMLFNLYSYTDPTQVQFVYNLTQSGIFRFGDDDLINGTELIIHNLGKSADATTPPLEQLIPLICSVYFNQYNPCTPQDHISRNDPNGYYSDFNDCVTFLSTKEEGSWDDLRSDTLLCRLYHAALAAIDHFHCPHVGRSGGLKCVNTPYANYYKHISYIV
jgi:hypothetical protein